MTIRCSLSKRCTGGVSQLMTLKGYASSAKKGERARLAGALCELLSSIVDPRACNVNVTGVGAALSAVRRSLPALIDAFSLRYRATLPTAPASLRTTPISCVVGPKEALVASSEVAFVAQMIPSIGQGDPLARAGEILSHILTTGALWEEVRMKGGAYGAFASSRTSESTLMLVSYRDPNTVATLEAYRTVLERFAANPVDEVQLEQAKVSILGRELRPLSPRAQGYTSFRRHLHDIDDPFRQRMRDQLLDVTPTAIQAAAQRVVANASGARTVVLSGRDKLSAWLDGDERINVTRLPV